MRLGFLTNYSADRAQFARQSGFNCLELWTMPGMALDPSKGLDGYKAARDVLQENGIAVSALACYFNHLEEGKEAERATHFRKVIEAAPLLGCPVVASATGVTGASIASGRLEDSLPAFKKVFSEHARVAEDNNVKIAFENWPGGHPWPLVINIAISPAGWDMIFDAVPSPVMGLEYDPSHLARLHIDYVKPIERYAARIHHVHAKDTTINREKLNEVGYIGQGWWYYSIPSLGMIEWQPFFRALKAINYSGDVDIEHEDPNYQGDKFDQGLVIGQKFLSQFVK